MHSRSRLAAVEQLPLLLTLTVWLGLANCELAAQNFTSSDPGIAAAAESARDRSATFWTGAPLPASWSSPCPIRICGAADPPCGLTRFQFARGEVFGWQMEVRGSRARLLSDVLPHEVDHMVRATLVRRPIPRWLDEGCAGLMESSASHRALRQQAERIDPATLTSGWCEAMSYPAHPSDCVQMYAVGFSLVEFLLIRGGPQRLIDLQRRPPPVSRNLLDLYGLTPDQLVEAWSSWKSSRSLDCTSAGCLLHGSPGSTASGLAAETLPRPRLTIWTATWCGPCQVFCNDWQRNAALRQWLQSNFDLQFLDYDQSLSLAREQQITSLPSFQTLGRVVPGYLGSEWLKRQLQTMLASHAPPVPIQEREPASTPSEDSSPEKPLNSSLQGSDTGNRSRAAEQNPEGPPALQHAIVDAPGDNRARESPKPARTSLASPRADAVPSMVSGLVQLAARLLPWTGLLGGTLATGGVGGIALTLLSLWIKRRWNRRSSFTRDRSEAGSSCPFPRDLEEARELLKLRRSEGRVAALDALRGMFLDDELDKLADGQDPAIQALVTRLRAAIDRRVDDVAPIATQA